MVQESAAETGGSKTGAHRGKPAAPNRRSGVKGAGESPEADSGSEGASTSASAGGFGLCGVDDAAIGEEEDDEEDDDEAPAPATVVPLPNAAEGTCTASRGVLAALSQVFSHLASLGARRQRVTCFHASRIPPIGIHDYLVRIARYFPCGDECLLVGLVYIDRMLKLQPDLVVSGLSIHRLLITSITLAAKFLNDVFYSNAHYAQVGGLRARELTALEGHFLRLIKWRLHVQPEEYDQYLGRVLAAMTPAIGTPLGVPLSHRSSKFEPSPCIKPADSAIGAPVIGG